MKFLRGPIIIWAQRRLALIPLSPMSSGGGSHAVTGELFLQKARQESLSRVLAPSFLNLQSPSLLGSQEPPESLALRFVLDCFGGP